MPHLSPANTGIVTMAGVQGISIFTALMPRRSEVLKASPEDEDFKKDLRHAECMSAGLVMGLAFLVTALTGDKLALVVGGTAVVGMVAAYELTLRM